MDNATFENRLFKKLDRMEAKLDSGEKRLDSIDITLASQHISLQEHMRRTALLEEQVEPLKSHVAMVHGALKLIGVVAAMAAIVESVISVIKH